MTSYAAQVSSVKFVTRISHAHPSAQIFIKMYCINLKESFFFVSIYYIHPNIVQIGPQKLLKSDIKKLNPNNIPRGAIGYMTL